MTEVSALPMPLGGRRVSLRWRVLMALPGLCLAGLAIISYLDFARGRGRLATILDATGAGSKYPEVRRAVTREVDLSYARLAVARGLLHAAFERDGEVPPEVDKETRLERLLLASRLAGTAARERPSAWQPSMIIGGARALRWLLLDDPRLYSDRKAWEQPLLEAIERAPGKREPLRLLLAARLQVWYALSDAERNETRERLARLFAADPGEISVLLEGWWRTAPTREDALSVIPERAEAWKEVERFFVTRGDAKNAASARVAWFRCLPTSLKSRLTVAEEAKRLRDTGEVRRTVQALLAMLPPSQPYTGTFTRCLDLLPPGSINRQASRQVALWLGWDRGLSFLSGDRIPPGYLARMAGLAGEGKGAAAAYLFLAKGEMASAASVEQRSRARLGVAWGSYFIAKARLLHDRGEEEEAREALLRVPSTARSRVSYLMLRKEVGESLDDDQLVDGAEEMLRAIRTNRVSAASWYREGKLYKLEVLLPSRASGMRLRLSAGKGGSVCDLRIDGTVVDTVAVGADTRWDVAASFAAGPHLIEVDPVMGPRVVPGEIEFIEAD